MWARSFCEKKPVKLRLHRVARADKRDNLRRSFCEVSPVKLRFHPVDRAEKLGQKLRNKLRKSKKCTALELSQMTKKS